MPAQSMTAYASHEIQWEQNTYRLHLKSLNNRYLELKWRAPRSWFPLETPLKKLLRAEFSRGSFDFWCEELPNPSKNLKDEDVLQYLQKHFEVFKKIPTDLKKSYSSETLSLILEKQSHLWWNPSQDSLEKTPQELELSLFKELLSKMKAEREKEGKELISILKKILKEELYPLYQKVSSEIPELKEIYKKEFESRLKDLCENTEKLQNYETRLQSEMTFLLEKKDVTEELDRIQIHLKRFEECLEKLPQPLGKRIDFIAQELGREWNTLGAKINRSPFFEHIGQAKVALEKIREQSLNLA